MTAQPSYTVVIPTLGRASLPELVATLQEAGECAPEVIILVDDRRSPGGELSLPDVSGVPVRQLRTGGCGPAAARNAGWHAATSDWIAFLDDDVRISAEWPRWLVADLTGLADDVGGTQARIRVPRFSERRPTDDERRTLGLESAAWITADMAYRRQALLRVGGFDPRFPRAYREDSDLALRVGDAGYRLVRGRRLTDHPIALGGFFRSISAQAGNADDALMRRRHGPRWRERSGAGRGRLVPHAVTVVAAASALVSLLAGCRKGGAVGFVAWAALTAAFTVRRILPGPRTPREVAAMAITSPLIPFVALWHRLGGELRARRGTAPLPSAVFFDRDDTLIHDVPYLSDPDAVRPMPGAIEALSTLRRYGVAIGVVSNQSGIGRGLIDEDQLHAVNARLSDLLGPFDTWQVCRHLPQHGCDCRKPCAGMLVTAARELGVSTDGCVMIGDIEADVQAAAAAGARGILVPTTKTLPDEIVRAHQMAEVARTLPEAVASFMGGRR